MNRMRRFCHNNWVFLVITVAVILIAVFVGNMSWFGMNPFASELFLDNPVQAAVTDNYRAYVTDSSYGISVTDGSGRLLYQVSGGQPDSTFDYLDSLTIDAYGDLYILDRILLDDGSTSDRERVIRLSEKGKSQEILYDVPARDEDGVPCLILDSPVLVGSELWFSEIRSDGVAVLRVGEAGVEELSFLPLDDAYDIVADSSFTQDLRIAVALMNGDVLESVDGETDLIYNAREYDMDDYPSIISEIAYAPNGRLLMNDIGRRVVLAAEDGTVRQVIGKGAFLEEPRSELGEYPIYSGLNVSETGISLLSSSYWFTPDAEDCYEYTISLADLEGSPIENSDVIGLSGSVRFQIILVYVTLLLLILLAIYAVVKLAGLLKHSITGQNRSLLLVLITAIAVTVGVATLIFNQCNERYIDKSVSNLSNVADLMEAKMDMTALEALDSPDDYFSEEYAALNEVISAILHSDVNDEQNVYAVLYRVKSNIVCEVYRNDGFHAVMYPMAGLYEGSSESEALESHERSVYYDYALSEGSYTFILLPLYNEAGEGIGLLEVGSDFNQQAQENQKIYRQALILAIMAVIIVMLLITELTHCGSAFKAKKLSRRQSSGTPPELVRPVAFLIFFTANITTAFLPIYGRSLWTVDFPLPAELAAALPLSAELVCSALSAILCSRLIQSLGLKPTAIIGAGFYVGGNLMSAFAGNLWVLICANSLCGIGGGLLLISVNTWITGLNGAERQNQGFIEYNAAYLSGMNCGTVIGSLVWESLGIRVAYYVAALSAALLAVSILLLLENKRTVQPRESHVFARLKRLFSPKILRYFLFLTVPYLICASFLSYYFPIVAEDGGLSATEISMAFLISGMISIYAGSSLGPVVTEKMGTKRAMILASFLYAVALFTMAANPTIANCYVVIILFAVADSFGLAAQSVYFADSGEVKQVGESWALGVNSTIESITSACGSMIFGAALMLGQQQGIFIIAAAFALLLGGFVIGGRHDDPSSNVG